MGSYELELLLETKPNSIFARCVHIFLNTFLRKTDSGHTKVLMNFFLVTKNH